MALASVLLNCSKHTFEGSKRELPSHSVPFTYSWVTDQYSTCTKQCGGGTQTRSLSCVRSTDNATVSNAHCSASTKPQTERACNTQACPTYNWKPNSNSYSSCTKQCGGGTQTRSLSCIRSTDNATVSNAHCSASTKPQTERACNTQTCPTYNWKPNSYSSCTKQCGGGTQTRSLSCIRSTDNATVSNAHCSASTKPQTERACNTQVCPTYNWKPNSYFSCTKQCGGGTQTRSLSCIRSTDNATVANRHCSASTKPQTERACNTQVCPTYNWKPNSYSSCTKQCGGGTQTRSLSCIRSTDNATVANRRCSASTKPQIERACNTQACPPTYNWKPSSYSSCTKQCGGGTQTRSLSCIRSTDNATVANARCSASTKPQTERACNTNACPPTYNWKPSSYSSCTKQCGGGTQTRSLSCIRSTDNATVANTRCSASTKPQTERVCNTNACPPTYNWKPNSYSSCTKQCGGGTQTRSLSCIRSTDNATVANAHCSASAKPQIERVCNTQAATRKTLYKKLTATEDTTNNQLDMLLVIDDSGSMYDDSSRLAAKLNGFVNKLKNSGIDWQMCVTTTSAEDYQNDILGIRKGNYGRPISWRGGNSGYILKRNSGDLNQIFIDTIDYLYHPRYVGGVRIGGSFTEEGIKAMNLSVQDNSRSRCYRDKAALSVILISDENENQHTTINSHLKTPQSFIQTVKDNFSPGKRLTVNSIVVKDELCKKQQGTATIGQEYITLSNLTGGSVQSICQSDYSIALNDIHNKIDQSLSGLPLACVPTSKPTVTVDYRAYTHVTVSGNQLFFNPIVQGPATIRGSYFCCGQ